MSGDPMASFKCANRNLIVAISPQRTITNDVTKILWTNSNISNPKYTFGGY